MEPADVRVFIDDAQDSVTLAQEAGADQLAPEEMARAESLLARAAEAAKEEKRGAEAIRLASEAKAKAEVAYAVSRQTKVHEQEIQRISSEKSREIAALESARKAAIEAEKEKAREAQACVRKLEDIEREKEKELAAARDTLRAAEERAARKERELAVATSEKEATSEKLDEALREVRTYSEEIERIEEEKEERVVAARAALKAAENNVRKAEAKVKAYSQRIAAMEREREKEIAVHIAREETAQKRAAEAQAEKQLLKGKPNLAALEEVRRAIEGWRIAWTRKDTDRYMSYYSDDAEVRKVLVAQGKETVQKLSKSQMGNEMERVFAREIQFGMGEPRLDAGSDAIRATFEFFKQVPAEAYEQGRGTLKHDKWIKELLFREVEGQWKIVNEEWKLYHDIPEYAERR
jgi:ketosteroid isomerase-like protein